MEEIFTNLPKWDLSPLFKTGADAKKFLVLTEIEVKDFAKSYNSKIASLTAMEILKAIEKYEKASEMLGKVGTYAYLLYATNMKDAEVLGFYQSIFEKISELSALLSFFTLELNMLEDDFINKHELSKYKSFLKKNRIFKPYELSKELEAMIIRKSVTSSDAWVRFYDEMLAGLEFNLKGKKVNITEVLHALSSNKEDERKAAAKELGKILKANIKPITFTYNMIVKDKQIEDEYRKFENPIDARNLSNFIERESVQSLIETVKKNYSEISHKYYKLKATIFGKEKLKYWDRNAPLPFADEKTFTYEEAKQITLKSYNEFHPKMAEIGKKFFENNWIDAGVYEGKDSGAFSHPSVPSANPFIMLNFLGKTRDVATMAHELGHGVHQFLASKQGYLMAGTPLTLAETASVFGEMLVFQNLLKTATTKEEKLSILGGKIEDMINTVIRQIAFCEFEIEIHDLRKKGELSAEAINEIFMKVQANSLGEGIELEEEYKYFWGYISHFFHAPFYVYAYAFGDILVNSLYAIYKNKSVQNFEEKYLQMLEAGGTLHHKELLAPFGIDLAQESFWQGGLDILKSYIEEFEKTYQI